MERFLIFALERSGSSSLAAALNTGYSVVQEPLSSLTGDIETNPKFTELLETSNMLPEQLPEHDDSPFAFNRFNPIAEDKVLCQDYLERLYRRFSGAKHVWNTVSYEANTNLLDSCLDWNIKVVFLTRRKLGLALVSRFLAQQAGIHDLGASVELRGRWEAAPFQSIDPEEFREQLEALQQADKAYRAHLSGRPCLLVTYEQLYQGTLRRPHQAFARLCKFLSIEQSELDPANVERYLFNSDRKQTRRETLERIPNYRELKRLL